ncbi:RdgB/HAM1 family non-canonical purine NTP pyrophosphatase [Nitrosomonas mobilis]|uniref:dITP/XTP pyrophosphatase n=1 Tax=Nitrosomonas mobilis TaxID=51642 RepID=A0A1G5SGP9_9PROT|nr:RdgB/HAM1 family non-canonical purine NTP pyrophosphatase [Nitrosomonas mobilis]SCZ85569.1 dITP/XTP pyrophosphatase [Nitrosomonas mobilis]
MSNLAVHHCFERIVLASGNVGKLAEIQQILSPLGIETIAQSAFMVPEIDEPFDTFLENALLKARHASRLSSLPALADDSGICVNALHGEPGVRSARYAGEPKSDVRNNQILVQALADESDRSAYFYCVLVLVRHAADPQPIIADGCWYGQIIAQPRGVNGFGYDPHFFLPNLGKTSAELSPEQKNQLSHRGQALYKLADLLAEHQN